MRPAFPDMLRWRWRGCCPRPQNNGEPHAHQCARTKHAFGCLFASAPNPTTRFWLPPCRVSTGRLNRLVRDLAAGKSDGGGGGAGELKRLKYMAQVRACYTSLDV